jgi:hypothetical protein
MKNKRLLIQIATTVLLFASLNSCKKDSDSSSVSTSATVPSGAALIVDKNFQESGAWPNVSSALIGYSSKDDSCGTANLTSNTEAYTWEETYYNGVNNDTVLIDYTDAAINTGCETGSGLASGGEAISKGFVIFNEKSARSGAATPTMVLSSMSYVSTVQFTLTATSTDGKGLSLYKSVSGGDFELVGTYAPKSTSVGEYYSIAIDQSDVSLKFVSEDSKNGYFRMHDLQVWSAGVPTGSVLYVEDYFQTWGLKGYVLPVPGVVANPTGTLYVPLASLSTVEYDTTITYVTGTPITYTIHDGAVNPDGYNHHGDVTLVYGLTTGYIELPINKTAYTNTDINASLTISTVPSVSLIEFWVAVSGMSGRYELYKSVDGGDYTLYKDLIVKKYAGIGKYFRFYVNEKNVSFKFTTYTGTDAYTTTPKIYGVKIWSNGN